MDGRLRLLLDTHVLVWTLSEPTRLADRARTAIEEEENDVFVSVVTPWEIAVKGPREGLVFPDDLDGQLDRHGFIRLPVHFRHTDPIASMPYHHRDPFDRMLVAQAVVDGMTIVTADRKLREYPVSLLHAL